MMDLAAFEALTFDCYGTLIDWERGILEALSPVLAVHGADAGGEEEILERFGRLESGIQAGPFRSYRGVLEEVVRRFGTELGFRATPAEVKAFAASVPSWPLFPDTVEALRALAGRYRLAVVSNVDDDLFSGTAARLGAPLEAVVTAQQVRSYKPARAHFDEVLLRLDLPRERVLHVAQSLFHDIAPARALGFRCVWVNRRASRPGSGATRPAEATPHMEVPDLATLVTRAGLHDQAPGL